MKVVKLKLGGVIIHREIPDFEEGKGIKNASKRKGIDENDLEEVDISQTEWDLHLFSKNAEKLGSLDPKLEKSLELIFDYLKKDKSLPKNKNDFKMALREYLKN